MQTCENCAYNDTFAHQTVLALALKPISQAKIIINHLSDESESLSPLALIALLDVNTSEKSTSKKKNSQALFFFSDHSDQQQEKIPAGK